MNIEFAIILYLCTENSIPMATVHPYKGYLNTKFYFYANGVEDIPYSILSKDSESDIPVLTGVLTPNILHSINLKDPGEYEVVFEDGTSSNIIVEDGYKFGGSAYKKSFIYDETPWCFVIMKDRTYFYNRGTEESYVETISPDVINLISPDYILLENDGQVEKTIYSLIDQKPILNVTDIVYYNKYVLIWEEVSEDTLHKLFIYSLQDRSILKTILVNKFTFDDETNSLTYIIDNTLHKQELGLPLKIQQDFHTYGQLISLASANIAISIVKSYNSSDICVFDIRENKIISRLKIEDAIAVINSENLIDINAHIDTIQDFDLSQIGCEEARIKATFASFSFYPTKWDVYCIIKECTYERGIYFAKKTTTYKVKSLSNGIEYPFEYGINKVAIRDKIACFANYQEAIIFGLNISPEYTKDVSTYIHNQDVIRSLNGNISFLDDSFGWKSLGASKYSFRYFDEFGVIKNEADNTFFNLHGDKLIGYLPSIVYKPFKHLRIGDKMVLLTGEVLPSFNTGIFDSNATISKSGKLGLTKDEEGIFLLIRNNENIIRKNILLDLFDTSSYKSVLLSEDGSQILYRDDKQTVMLDVCTNTTDRYDNVSYVEDINGIRPLFSHRAGSLQPRIVNPVTGQILPHNRMAAYQFVSPNGLLYADTAIDEYVETWDLIANIILSDSEIAEYAEKFGFIEESENEKSKINEENRRKFIVNNLPYFKEVTKNWTERSDNQLIDILLSKPYADFAKLFMERRGVAYIKNKSNDSVVAKIKLGAPLWFLNYVSFSYDNRYVAIAGRYPNNSNDGGLFLVYDLIKKEEVLAIRNLWAVWMTSFNIQNHVAAYSGEPISYSLKLYDNDESIKVDFCEGYSFLTFSPNGEYAALSNQGYVSKYDKHGNERLEWGHMPSCEVYIVKSCDFNEVLIKFSDLSNSGIEGLSDKKHNCSKTVTSVSFSNDNKRLMMVGNDGVVIIRNLHLDIYADE